MRDGDGNGARPEIRTIFEALVERQPTEKEIESLYRAKKALNIRENDALWHILIALESYDTLYRKYPALVASEAAKAMEELRGTAASLAQAETAKAVASLADAASDVARRSVDKALAASLLLQGGWTLFAAALFGASCLFVGFMLGSGAPPYRTNSADADGTFRSVLSDVLATPVGWTAVIGGFAFSLTAACVALPELRKGGKLGILAGAAALSAVSMALGLFLTGRI
jgi:hypothetical protein